MGMTSWELVLAVIEGKIPDQVPWIENYVSNEVVGGPLGHTSFFQANYSQKIQRPEMIRIPPSESAGYPPRQHKLRHGPATLRPDEESGWPRVRH
jgi:hypothetical protein